MVRNRKLRLENLEGRSMLAVTAVTNGFGDVVVSGNAAGAVVITQTAPGQYDITENGVEVGTGPHIGTRDLIVRLGNAADDVTIDLGTFTIPDDLVVMLGRGDNTLTIDNGGVNDDVVISSLTGLDTVTLGGSAGISADDMSVNLDGGGNDSLTLGTVDLDDFFSFFNNNLSISSDTTIGNNARIVGGTAGNDVTIDGSIGHDLLFTGSAFSNTTDSLTVNGSVGHDIVIYTDSIWLNRGGEDTVVLNGIVGHDVFINAGGGDDSITLDEGFSMNPSTRLRIYTGNGNDTLTVNTTFPTGLKGTLDGGVGSSDTYVGPAVTAPLTKVGFEL